MACGELCITNDDLAAKFSTAPEVIFRKIGIESRPLARADMSPKELAFEAVAPLLENTAFDPATLAMVIVSSSSVSQTCPPVACEVLGQIQKRHPNTPDAMAFDIMGTCSGWLYGLSMACDQLHQPGNRSRSALIVTTEIFSQGIAADDFGAWASFGDAATATLVLGPDAPSAAQPESGYLRMRRPHCFAQGDPDIIVWGPPLNMEAKLRMDGYALRHASVPAMVKGLNAAMDSAGLTTDDLHIILAHQSNHRVLADLASQFGVDPAKMASNLRFRGNTSSSALPLLLHDLRAIDSALPGGATVGFTAFGGGFTYGGAIARVL